MAPASLSSGLQSFTPIPTINLGTSGASCRVGGFCEHSRPLWVSPRTSPVRLGVSPALPQPPRAFSIRGLRLYFPSWSPGLRGLLRSPLFIRFIYARMWGRGVLLTALPAPFSTTLSPALSVYLCVNVGPQGLLVVRLPSPFVPHSPSLGHGHESPLLSTLVPVSVPPTGLDVCFLFYLLGVGLPCCSIFRQFWLCEEAQCVYLRCHLGFQAHYLFK